MVSTDRIRALRYVTMFRKLSNYQSIRVLVHNQIFVNEQIEEMP